MELVENFEVLSEIDGEKFAGAIATGAAVLRWPPEQQYLCDGFRSCSSCAMAARAAVVVRWPPEHQVCREIIEAVEEVKEAQRRQRERLDRRRRGTTGNQAETDCVRACEL